MRAFQACNSCDCRERYQGLAEELKEAEAAEDWPAVFEIEQEMQGMQLDLDPEFVDPADPNGETFLLTEYQKELKKFGFDEFDTGKRCLES